MFLLSVLIILNTEMYIICLIETPEMRLALLSFFSTLIYSVNDLETVLFTRILH